MRGLGFFLLICTMAGISGATAAPATEPNAAPFDAPVKFVRIPQPANRQNPDAGPSVTCSYFKDFMVKQVDLGDQGSAEMAVLPDKSAVCQRKVVANERIVSPKQWAGYFRGVVGDAIFLDGSSAFDGGRAFAIFTPAVKKIFEDVANGFYAISAPPGQPITIHYRRVYASHCSLAGAKPDECWAMIVKDTALTRRPDCNAAYVNPNAHSVFGIEDPSVIEYDAQAIVTEGGKPQFVPVAGRDAVCRMAE
jgi:hypothetical protein